MRASARSDRFPLVNPPRPHTTNVGGNFIKKDMNAIYINRFVYIILPFFLICGIIAHKITEFTVEDSILLLPFFVLLIILIVQVSIFVNRYNKKKLFYNNPIIYSRINENKELRPVRHQFFNIEISENESNVSVYDDNFVKVYIDKCNKIIVVKKNGVKNEIKISGVKYLTLEFDDFFYFRINRNKALSIYISKFSLVLLDNSVLHLFNMTNSYNSYDIPSQGERNGPDYYFEKGQEILQILSRITQSDYAIKRY